MLVNLGKREEEEEIVKKRSMSYDLNANKVCCKCCGKSDLSVLSSPTPSCSEGVHLCSKCSSALSKKQDYASTKNGTAKVSDKGPNLVEFTCRKGHSWTVNIHRGYKNWCSSCLRMAKEKQKQQYKRKRSEANKENADKQKKLFEDAKSQVSKQTEVPHLESFEDLFASVLPTAKAKADAFFAQPDVSGSCTYEQALCVYKILELDAD